MEHAGDDFVKSETVLEAAIEAGPANRGRQSLYKCETLPRKAGESWIGARLRDFGGCGPACQLLLSRLAVMSRSLTAK
jgi:hypothetical protein